MSGQLIKHVYCCLLSMVTVLAQFNCPIDLCGCEVQLIRCDGLALKAIPKRNPVNETLSFYLSIGDNQITTIHAGDLPPLLVGINLQENPITTIDEMALVESSRTLTELLFSNALMTELPSGLLHLDVLQSLTIQDTPIQSWNSTILQHIGLTVSSLQLRGVPLSSFSTWIKYFIQLATLHISNAPIVVTDDAFDNQLRLLVSLSLPNTSLTSVPTAISKLEMLAGLYLDDNSIEELTSLPQYGMLNTLTITNNRLNNGSQVTLGLQPVATSLQVLQLIGNRLTTAPDLFSMMNLQITYLTRNRISSVGSARIPTKLKTLGLDNNMLPQLNPLLQTGDSLDLVILAHNSIQVLQGSDLSISITDLDLSYNRISQLTEQSFPVNSKLALLNLDSNPISQISDSAFANLKELSSLTISSTKLTRLPMALASLTKLYSLNVDDNAHLVCTCMESSLRQWALQSPSMYVEGMCGVASIQTFLQTLSQFCPKS